MTPTGGGGRASGPDPLGPIERVLDGPVAMVVLAGGTHVVRHANPAFCELLSSTRDEIIGRALIPLLPEGPRADTTRLLDELAEGGPTRRHENHARVSGPWEQWAWTVRDSELELEDADTVVLVIDRTQQTRSAEVTRQTREANRRLLISALEADVRADEHARESTVLGESVSLLRATLDASPDLVVIVDPSTGLIEYANAAWRALAIDPMELHRIDGAP